MWSVGWIERCDVVIVVIFMKVVKIGAKIILVYAVVKFKIRLLKYIKTYLHKRGNSLKFLNRLGLRLSRLRLY